MMSMASCSAAICCSREGEPGTEQDEDEDEDEDESWMADDKIEPACRSSSATEISGGDSECLA